MVNQSSLPPELRRIALIGPVIPFRGGIAQHTTMLHKSAFQLADILTISFTRLYPGWLFPGKSELDPAFSGHRESGVEYLIDSLNPLSWQRAVKRVLKHRPEFVIIPWWTTYWSICFWYLCLQFRRAGIKVVFLCHNVVDHESARWKIFLSKHVLQQAHYFVVQSNEDVKSLKELVPGAKISFHPHPLYNQFPKPHNELPRRADLELLFLGFVRSYKGVDLLIDALNLVPEQVDLFLTIAGEFWQGKKEIVHKITEKSLQEKVEIIDKYLPEQEVADLLQRADLVVLPYRSATGSGIVSLAYHYNKPVLVTRVGGFPDVVVEGETGLIVSPENPEKLAEALASITKEKLLTMAANIAAYKKQFSWEGLVKTILNMPANISEG